jgi:hypothetical protein
MRAAAAGPGRGDGGASFEGELTIPLAGQLVELEPLEPGHGDELFAAAQAPEIFRWLAHVGRDREAFDGWMDATLTAAATGAEG